MKRKTSSKDRDAHRWFLQDHAITNPGQDRLSHSPIAATLVEAIQSSKPPCMIGLLAEFGKGKSSTANIAADRLRATGQYDTVTVNADKHSGNERARNLVHAVAAQIETLGKIQPAEVREILRPLRQATEVSAPDPTDTPLRRFVDRRYGLGDMALSFAPFFAVAAVMAAIGLAAGGAVGQVLAAVAAFPPVIWLFAQIFLVPGSPGATLVAPSQLVDQMPRAEAADEIEEVFGNLIDLHAKRRPGRKLVIFVDDIDRLGRDDLLDALRSLRSLQSVPRGREPIFVIACNEDIVRTAVASSADAPASGQSEDRRDSGSENHDTTSGQPSDPPRGSTTPNLSAAGAVDSDHDHPALAFVDKLLTIRVQMPPTMKGDMRRFALELIGPDHPLRSEPGLDVEQVVAVLVHDKIDEPRSVIRILNRFIAAYLLAKEREASGAVFAGDVTGHPETLAQLTVILDEFPEFHRELASTPELLAAARRVASDDRT